jgi:hypothetical protein
LGARTVYHIVQTAAREPNLIVLKSAQSLLEEHNKVVDSG